MSGSGWTHRGKTYDSPADVIEELVADRDKWKVLAEKLKTECDDSKATLLAIDQALYVYAMGAK